VENEKSTHRGGPWTPKLKKFFDKAGMSMEDVANKVRIPGHKGPHPQAYHERIYQRLAEAVEDCTTKARCREALTRELGKLAKELKEVGSDLNKLVTGARWGEESDMAHRYFELTEDMTSPARWLLGDPIDEQGNEVRTRQFMSGEPTHFDGRLRVPIYHPGTSLDFTRVDPGAIPVVTEKVARVLSELAPGDVQLFPVEMEVSGKGMPKSLVTKDGRVGVLLGLTSSTLPQRLDTPAGEVRLVTVKTLLPSELAYRAQHGKQGREELVRRFVDSGEEHLSRAKRRAVV
jgi:hypothetical protein